MFATPSSRYLIGSVPMYSVLIVLGICAALFIASREEKRLALPQDTVVDLALWVIPFGVIGARLYYVVFSLPTFAGNPISILYIWQGGLAIYGAVLGGLLAAWLFSRRRGLAMASLTDMIVPGLALAQAIGRWGNYFNMEAYGLQITDPAWQFFPLAVLIPDGGAGQWHMATFFYESVWNLIVFAVLMLSRRALRRKGDATLWYILLYGCGRLVIEGLRTDSLTAAQGSIRVSQLLSVLMVLATLIIWLVRRAEDTSQARLWYGLCAALTAALLALLLPVPTAAFPGYQIILCLLLALICFAGVFLPFSIRTVIMLFPALGLILLHLFFAYQQLNGIEAATCLNLSYSLACIATGNDIYFTKER